MINDFSVLFDHNPSPMWIYGLPSLRILKVNQAAIAAYGYSEKEFLAMAISDIRPRFNLEKFSDYLNKEGDAANGKFITAGIWKHQNKRGQPIYAEISGCKICYEASDCRIIVATDVTEKILSQKEIALTQTNLEGLIDNTDDYIWSVNQERRYVYMNNAYKKAVFAHTGIMPVKGEQHHSAKYVESYGEPLINEWRGYYDRAFNGEKYLITKQGLSYTSGNPTYFETHFNPIYAATGEIIGVGCFSRNISQRLKDERALIDQNNRLKHIATLSSHELRRPVASMLGLINVLDRENFSNPANQEIIDLLFTVSTEIDTVIHQIVDKTFFGDLNID